MVCKLQERTGFKDYIYIFLKDLLCSLFLFAKCIPEVIISDTISCVPFWGKQKNQLGRPKTWALIKKEDERSGS